MRILGKHTAVLAFGSVRLFSTMNRFSCPLSLVICGPSGVGKGTIISNLLALFPERISLSVSHTTRKPRPGEIDGMHYYFTDREEMELDICSGTNKFIEFAHVHGNIYGTSHHAIESIHSQNKVCLLDVDTRGVKQLKEINFPAKYVFISPPTYADLEKRLLGRGTETKEQTQIRLHNAQLELAYGTRDNFDLVVVNDKVHSSVDIIVKNLVEWFPSQEFSHGVRPH